MRSGATFELELADRVQWEAFVLRRYAPALVELILARLPARGGTVFDVGAHVGLVGIEVAARRGAAGVTVHAFEPNPVNAASLRRNLERNPGLDLMLNEVAVGERDGEARIGWAAVGTDLAGSRIVSPEQASGLAGAEVRGVRMITLDGYVAARRIERVDVVKLDVEGHELAVLDGASRLLAGQRVGCLVCELNDVYLGAQGFGREDVVRKLRQWGYRQVAMPRVGAQRLRPRREGDVVDVAFVPEGPS